MLWRSVVGKLWLTILLLVLVVLIILTMLLTQFFETFHDNQAKEQLEKMADRLVVILERDPDSIDAVRNTKEMAEVYSMSVMMIDSEKQPVLESSGENEISLDVFLSDEQLKEVPEKEIKRFVKDEFPFVQDSTIEDHTMIIYGEPYRDRNGGIGAVYVYQSIENIAKTTDYAKKLIFIAAGIAIILTTVFAFFLSSRITAPLRKMREAAMLVAKGEFDAKVPILTHDEIGELGMTFNRMGRQLKNYVQALNQEKEQLSGVLSSMADGVITFDRKMNILVTNPPADRFLQACYYETGMAENDKSSLPESVMLQFNQVVTLEREQLIEVTLQGRSWVVVMTPLYNQSMIRGAVAVLRDMTEERRMDKLRKDFVANVSHELKTPIAMLQGYSEAIVDDIAESEEEKKELAGIILDESRRMSRLVNELLDLARFESGQMKLYRSWINVPEYAARVLRKFQGPAKDRNIHLYLETQTDNEHAEIYADADRLEQVLTNLIDNAIRHTSEDGSVILKADVSDSAVKMDVIDTGSGIPEEDLPFVFERFYKSDKARTRGKSGGTGLGLAIAKNIVEAHDGIITAHSKEGEGTTFSFVLPRNVE